VRDHSPRVVVAGRSHRAVRCFNSYTSLARLPFLRTSSSLRLTPNADTASGVPAPGSGSLPSRSWRRVLPLMVHEVTTGFADIRGAIGAAPGGYPVSLTGSLWSITSAYRDATGSVCLINSMGSLGSLSSAQLCSWLLRARGFSHAPPGRERAAAVWLACFWVAGAVLLAITFKIMGTTYLRSRLVRHVARACRIWPCRTRGCDHVHKGSSGASHRSLPFAPWQPGTSRIVNHHQSHTRGLASGPCGGGPRGSARGRSTRHVHRRVAGTG